MTTVTCNARSWSFRPEFRPDTSTSPSGFVLLGRIWVMLHSRAMGQGLFELRLKSNEGIGRVFYRNRPDQRVMFLHGFVKKSAKTPVKGLKIARDRMKEAQADAYS